MFPIKTKSRIQIYKISKTPFLAPRLFSTRKALPFGPIRPVSSVHHPLQTERAGGRTMADESEQRTRMQMWEAIRRLSDAERERVQQLIVAPASSSSRKDAMRIPLTLVDADDGDEAAASHTTIGGGALPEDNQADNDAVLPATKKPSARITQWSPSDLIHAFLEHLHHAVQSQQATSASAATTSEPSVTGHPAADKTAQRMVRPTTSSKSSSFALQKDDFPSLLSAPAKAANAPQKPNAKVAKRRITTTLLSDQNVITRPVLHAVAFPPLGGGGVTADAAARSQSIATTNSNPWAKRELLERRMMSSVEPGGAPATGAIPESPAQSPVLTKSRVGHHDKTADTVQVKKLFDDSPPNGPKRVQPFPVVSSQRPEPAAASCQSPVMVTTPLKVSSGAQQPPPMLLCVKPKRRQVLLSTTASESNALSLQQLNSTAAAAAVLKPERVKTALDFTPNVQAAKLYAFLISKRLVGSTCAELQLLISLLFRSDCAAASSGSETIGFDSGPTASVATAVSCASSSEFCWRGHCLAFAATVFDGIEHILGSLGSELLQLLTSSLADAGICADMLERLQQLAQRREELRVEESARIGCKLPVETKASAVRDFALPFCEEMDSRLHYRSPTESVLYSNREKVRDSFLDLLRHFQKQQHSLLGIESAQVAASAVASANNLLGEVSPENRWWFAKFFVLELIQVGANPFGESDKDLVLKIMGEDKLVVKNPDRLRKLHRRFSSQKQSTKAPATSTNQAPSGSNSNSSNNNGNHSSKNQSVSSNNNSKSTGGGGKSDSRTENNNHYSNNSTKSSPAGASSGYSVSITATFETTRAYFAENQQFFFHFLHSCDSYEFSQLVKYQLETQFQAIWRDNNTSNSSSSISISSVNTTADARKSFTDVVLKLKVVAKFLGYLRFSPHWHNSSSLVQLSKQNPAFKAAKKEAIWTLENAESVGLDVKLLLEQSIMDAKLSKCVPWLCDYLTMLSLDKLSLSTTYFRQLLVLLERIYHSSRLDALGETGLYIAMQIERVFHVLDVDVAGFLDDTQLRSPVLQPPTSLLLALENVKSSVTFRTGEDTLPFLYSQVFVQSCVNELEDLRGFIQTRAKPSHRALKHVPGGLAHAIPIRKLRPLQVVMEDEHNDELLLLGKADATSAAQPSSSSSSPFGSSATTMSDDDKLSESIFKIHPNLRKVVEFVVEVVATNICEHVLQQIVTPSVDAFINSCVSESGLNPRGSRLTAELDSATILFLQLLDNRTARTIHEDVSKSLSEANRLCEDKVRASVPPLIPPSCHPTLAKAVMLVALNRTRGVVRNLIPKSSRSEFLKRLAFRKKAILKETASKSVAQASNNATTTSTSGSDEDNVVRTLSSMFDEHAGVEDSNEDELLLELRQTSAQIFKLCSTRHARASLDEWTKLHASLSRHVRSFINSLEELDNASVRPESDLETTRRQIHELPVWDATWRVVLSCLRVITRLTHSVTGWAGSSSPSPAESFKALEKTVSGFVDSFISLLNLVLATESHRDVSQREAGDEDRLTGLIRVVSDCLLSTPPSLQLELLEHLEPSALLVQRLVLTPRARVLAAIASVTEKAPAMLSTHLPGNEQHSNNQKATELVSEDSLSTELRARLRARDC